MSLIAETLNDYAKKARQMKRQIETFQVHNEETALQFIKLIQEYDFITGLFNEMNLFNWSDDDFNVEI